MSARNGAELYGSEPVPVCFQKSIVFLIFQIIELFQVFVL